MQTPEKTPVALTVALATMSGRMDQITLPPRVEGIEYLITVQGTQAPRTWPERSDVTVLTRPDDRGLSRNRNLGLEAASGELVLFCDDDVVLNPEGLVAMRALFSADPELALAAGWRAGRMPPGATEVALSRFNSGRICAPEFVIRRPLVLQSGVRFDMDFGVGAGYPIGEDYIFVCDLLRAGLRGLSVPFVIGDHAGQSTGDEWQDDVILKARARVLRRVFGPLSLLIRPVYALKHRKRFATPARALKFGLWG